MILPHQFKSQESTSKGPQAGFSMIEVMVFATMLLMGLMALTSTAMTVDRLRRTNEAQLIATNALESMVAEIRQAALRARGPDTNWAQTLVDAYGAAGNPGPDFPVRGLDALEGAPGVLHLELITDETLTDQELGVQIGLPIDQNNDGFIASTDTTADAQILPVLVTLDWTSPVGEGTVQQAFFVTNF